MLNGVRYETAECAANELNLSKQTIYAYANGSRHSSKYECTYDNQQPSQTNTSESSLEGSTTNE